MWAQFAALEGSVGETERSRAVFELAIRQPVLDMPETLWKAYIDFEVGWVVGRGRRRMPAGKDEGNLDFFARFVYDSIYSKGLSCYCTVPRLEICMYLVYLHRYLHTLVILIPSLFSPVGRGR